MEFKTLTQEDAESISAYVHDMWVDTYAPIILGGRERAESIFDDWVGPDRIRKDMEAGHFFLNPILDGEAVGLISAGKEGDNLVISKMYISPDHRNKGLGRKCMDYLLDYGRESGCRTATLEVNPLNSSAKNFYESFGFTEIRKRKYLKGYTVIMAVDL